MDGPRRANCIVPYRESSMWQGLAVALRSLASLPAAGSDSWALSSMLQGIVYFYAVR